MAEPTGSAARGAARQAREARQRPGEVESGGRLAAQAKGALEQRAELSDAAKAALAQASQQRAEAPPRMGQREQIQAVQALIEGADSEPAGDPDGADDGRDSNGRFRRREREAPDDADGTGADDSDPDGREEGQQRRADDEREDDADDDGQEREHGADDMSTLDDLARAAGLTRRELNKLPLNITGPKGEAWTIELGELKTRMADLYKLDHDRAEYAESRSQFELERVDHERRLRAIVDAIPVQALPPRLMQRIEAQAEETKARESAMLRKARPEWGDSKYQQRELAAMTAAAKVYGFTETEVNTILDHRVFLLLQDFARDRARIAASTAAARRVEPTTERRPGQESQRAALNQPRRGVSRKQDLAAAAARLIARG